MSLSGVGLVGVDVGVAGLVGGFVGVAGLVGVAAGVVGSAGGAVGVVDLAVYRGAPNLHNLLVRTKATPDCECMRHQTSTLVVQNRLALVLVHVLAPLLVVVLMVVRCESHDTWAWSKALQHVVAVVPQVVVVVLCVAAAALTQVVAATLP